MIDIEFIPCTVEATLMPLVCQLGGRVILILWQACWHLGLLSNGLTQWELQMSCVTSRPAKLEVGVRASEE